MSKGSATIVILLILTLSLPAGAHDLAKYEFGLWGAMAAVSGDISDDMTGGGVVGRYRLNSLGEGWLIGVGFDYTTGFGVEDPTGMLCIRRGPSVSVDATDVDGDGFMISSWIEKRYNEKPQGGLSWFWTAGLGINFVNVDTVRGGTADGGQFEIETDSGTEFVLSSRAGPRYTFTNNWSAEMGIKLDHHFADWTVRDRITGRSASVDDYTSFGGYIGISYSF